MHVDLGTFDSSAALAFVSASALALWVVLASALAHKARGMPAYYWLVRRMTCLLILCIRLMTCFLMLCIRLTERPLNHAKAISKARAVMQIQDLRSISKATL